MTKDEIQEIAAEIQAREEYARRKFEALTYEQLVKAYNDMQVPE